MRLFGLLTVLAGVNVYVFFFNRGTAPREVLKPSSLMTGAESKSGTLRRAASEAQNAVDPAAANGATPVAALPSSAQTKPESRKAKLPVPIAPMPGGGSAAAPAQKQPAKVAPALASGDGPPKGSPGGSPGQANSEGLPSQDGSSEGSLEKKITDADTLGQILAREGFDSDGPRVVAALSRLMDPKTIRGGQSYTVRLDEQGEPEAFEYRPNPVSRFLVTRGQGSANGSANGSTTGTWIAVRVDQPLETKVVASAGIIDATLYESVQTAGERSALASLLVDLLAWDVNFYTDTQPGDHWKVIVEKQFLGGEFYRYGHVLAAEYGGKVGTVRAFYWNPKGSAGDGRYYDEKGQAIVKNMLKTPLRYVRVSSKFDRHRFHPILHQERAHLGIDYAAPKGTPVWASASGKVMACEMMHGSGNTVVISHANHMTTRYYHLSRFARGLKVGQPVKQKEVIGFVGTTGLSTGPHLHFSVTQNGAFVDPGKVRVNRDPPVADRAAYIAAIKARLATLRELEPGPLARN